MRCLRQISNYGIHFSSGDSRHSTQPLSFFFAVLKNSAINTSLCSHSNAHFTGDQPDHKSTPEAVHLYNNASFSWSCHKQSLHTLSTCEAEYVAASSAAQTTFGYVESCLSSSSSLPKQPICPWITSSRYKSPKTMDQRKYGILSTYVAI